MITGILLVFPLFVFAYSAKTTHPALTNEIVKFFNQHYSDLSLSEKEKELLIQGSTDEDEGVRPLHHFYDPVFDRGITIAGIEWQKSKEWAQDPLAQAGIIDGATAGTLKSFLVEKPIIRGKGRFMNIRGETKSGGSYHSAIFSTS